MMSSNSTSRARPTRRPTCRSSSASPAGLGLHLIRRLVDSWDYAYSKESRQSRITFRKTVAGHVPSRKTPNEEGEDAGD